MGLVDLLPERLRRRATAEAIMAPSGVLLAGASAAGGVLAGLGLPVSLVIGVGAWLVKTWTTAARGARRPGTSGREIADPYALSEPWKQLALDAQQARGRFSEVIRQTDTGPLRTRLAEIGAQVSHGVDEAWTVASRGDALDAALYELDSQGTDRRLRDIEHTLRASRDQRPDLEATAASLRSQLQLRERMERRARETEDQLRFLTTQLDESVARAIELRVTASEAGDLSPLDAQVGELVTSLEALRRGINEIEATTSPGETSTQSAPGFGA